MSFSDFTPQQRRTVRLLAMAVIVVFALLTGFVVTSVEIWRNPVPAATLPGDSPTPPPPGGTPRPSPAQSQTPDEGIWSQVQAARLFDQIARQVETLRGLSPRVQVPLNFLDEREMIALLEERYAERDPEAQLRPYVALGLLPDVRPRIRAPQAAGVYVPEQQQLYVALGRHQTGADDQALLAHVYARALRDQHFDLAAVGARAETSDAKLAVQALAEGDAMLVAGLYRYDDLRLADWAHLTELALQADQPSYGEELDASAAWARLQRFPYHEGRELAATLYELDGWEGIDRAYADPPRSTEQVLHPERYLGEERDEPMRVVVPDLSGVLGEGWHLLLQETLGELVVGLYLEETLSPQTAWQAADGWGGDTFLVWEHEDGSRIRIWRTMWDNVAEAAEFESALGALIPQRYLPAWPLDPPKALPGRWWQTGAGAVAVHRVARYVTYVEAPDPNALANVVEVLP